MVSVLGRGYAQPSSLFGKSDRYLVYHVASPMMIGISPKKVTTQFFYVVANFLREKCGLHGIYQDWGDRCFDKGGPVSHRNIFGLPSFNTLTNIIHQILIRASSAAGGENGHSKVGSNAVCGGKSKDSRHLIFDALRGAGRNQVLDLVTLMSYPDDSQKFNKSLLRFLQSLAMALVKRKISSAKNKCKRRTPALKFIGRISLSWTASSNLMDNLSKHRINIYGERGPPWRRPLLGITSGRGEPFHRIWNRVEEIIFMMRVTRVGGNWKNSRVSWIKDHSS